MAAEHTKANVLNPTCPSRQVLDMIADKWAVMIVMVLARGRRRHGELKMAIGGVSQKMLSQTLRSLEHDGLVERTVYPVVPPRVEYALTPLGMDLSRLLCGMAQWAEDHLPEVYAARANYQATTAPTDDR